jgi:hypothetical protein
MRIMSIQSSVAYGHVGNSAAVFPLQRLGHEVWPVLTVVFSNHTGYGAWRGQVFPSELIGDLVEGIAERGALPRCDAVLSGYMGSAEIGVAFVTRDNSFVKARVLPAPETSTKSRMSAGFDPQWGVCCKEIRRCKNESCIAHNVYYVKS